MPTQHKSNRFFSKEVKRRLEFYALVLQILSLVLLILGTVFH